MLNEVKVEVEALVYPTEDYEKVVNAINNIASVQDINDFEVRPGIRVVRGKGFGIETLAKLQSLIRQDRIRDAARSLLRSATTSFGLLFYLNKQVALVNHISFCEAEGESPLGPITIRIECSDTNMIVDWLAPNIRGR